MVCALARTAAVIGLLAIAVPAKAQSVDVPGARPPAPAPARNAIYGELGGNGFLYSINYERKLGAHAGVRAGFEMLRASVALSPVMVDVLTGSGRHHLELGAGLLVGIGAFDGDLGHRHFAAGALPTATIGYRYQNPGSGMILRIGATPFPWVDGAPIMWFGVSVGRSF